jgi:hypothetical protein
MSFANTFGVDDQFWSSNPGRCPELKLTNAFGVVNEKQWLLNPIGTARRIQSHTFSGMRETHLGMSYGDGAVPDAIHNFGLG